MLDLSDLLSLAVYECCHLSSLFREELRRWWNELPVHERLFIPICALNVIGIVFFQIIPFSLFKIISMLWRIFLFQNIIFYRHLKRRWWLGLMCHTRNPANKWGNYSNNITLQWQSLLWGQYGTVKKRRRNSCYCRKLTFPAYFIFYISLWIRHFKSF